MSIAINNHANYWHNQKALIQSKFAAENTGTINAFSTVPKLDGLGILEVYENIVYFKHPNQPIIRFIPHERNPDDIKKFSSKSRKRLFQIFNSLQYTSYGLPCFISATWHFDSPDTRTKIKYDLDKFVKMLKRGLPEFHAIWKLEYQKRGVPHFHFILLPLDKKIKMWNPDREKFIKEKWLSLKKCTCQDCLDYSIKIVSCDNYKMSISYISKEIAKVITDYVDHDLGRIWGTSQNLRTAPLAILPCPISSYHKIVDKKLKEKFTTENQKIYVNGLRFLEQNSSVFIAVDSIHSIISSLNTFEEDKELSYKRFKS